MSKSRSMARVSRLLCLPRLCVWCIGMFAGSLLVGCGGGHLLVKHDSRIKRKIKVYVNWRLVCQISPQETCKKKLKPGRYYFYAHIEGQPRLGWASAQRPALFAVDERTVIRLHDPRLRPGDARRLLKPR